MQKWEYLILNLSGSSWADSAGRSGTIKYKDYTTHKDLWVVQAAVLNDLGREGWEMTGINRADVMYVKRPQA